MQTLTEIRASFLNFFRNHGHELVASSSLVPKNDPTLMFTTAGMVQFKDVFTGQEQRNYRRATTAQKCVRAGGKHNDLENVGYTARHHTFFEMLGNFSFGDYFKEEAIKYAWTFVHQELAIPKDKLLVTVYAEDEEAATLWKKIAHLPDEKIIRIATSDNFWSMGDVGPCGPCTEIFYDHGAHIAGGPPGSPDEDGDRFVEIWNLVFMQYEQLADGTRVALPKPSVDTGMGIERMAAVLQGVHNNYDTDLFKALIQASIDLTHRGEPGSRHSHNVIADHLRAASFLLAEGVMPSNEGRGYVLRRIMRRAMRHAHLLGASEPLMHRLVPTLVEQMGSAYPELGRAQPLIVENLKLEEERFRQTLGRGLKLLEEETLKLSPSQALDGHIAFKLYDTYGFPLDLTQDVLKGQGRDVDVAGFEVAMQQQKAAARASWVGSGDLKGEHVWYDLKQEHGATEFLGYQSLEAEGVVLALLNEENELIDTAIEGQRVKILFNQTPFYAESGGQQGDQGWVISPDIQGQVLDTLKKGDDLHIHLTQLIKGSLKVGDAFKLTVDRERRLQTQANHSATHLLHATLRKILGNHVSQKGSLVAADRLRFDFTHRAPLTADEIFTIEQTVNQEIVENYPVETQVMDAETAIAQGAMALFGEKYGAQVRVLKMGKGELPFSVELCGGTHVTRTGDIGIFKILSEAGVSAGIRRIEAITGLQAWKYLYERDQIVQQIGLQLKTPSAEVVDKISQLTAERRLLEKKLAEARQKLAAQGAGGKDTSSTQQMGPYQVIVRQLENMAIKDLKPLADTLKKSVKEGIIILLNKENAKISLVIGVTENLTPHVNAVELVQIGSQALGGKGGGGRPEMAQGGGIDPTLIPAALQQIEDYLGKKGRQP